MNHQAPTRPKHPPKPPTNGPGSDALPRHFPLTHQPDPPRIPTTPHSEPPAGLHDQAVNLHEPDPTDQDTQPTPARVRLAISAAAQTNQRDAAILELTFYLALRPIEVSRINMSNCRRPAWIVVSRAKKRRQVHDEIPAPPQLLSHFWAYVRSTQEFVPSSSPTPLFRSRKRGTRLSVRTINHVVRHYSASAGMAGISPRSARHYAATNLAGHAGARAAMALLGHSSLATTQHYLDCSADTLKAALIAAHAGDAGERTTTT